VNVLVIGDSCKDIFIYGEIARLSPEAPVPVFNPLRETSNDGMAKNVVNNVESLEAHVYSETNRNSIRKVRYVDQKSNQLVLRVDEHDYCNRIDKKVLENIRNNTFRQSLGGETKVDAIIISDYCKGFLEKEDIQYICENNENVFIDTKKELGDWINSATYIKINSLEYEKNTKFFTNDNAILEKTIITKGNEGCSFQGKIYPTEDVQVKDISGAGDTFLAGLVIEYTRTNDIIKAINFAQECTKIVVQKHGVSVVTKEEIQNYE
jgi:D-beta-D-heptose 7-phosphate kinase/D-beta-D-heptose 1-phosphate adenosyltransferase